MTKYVVYQTYSVTEVTCVYAEDPDEAIVNALDENNWDRLPIDEDEYDFRVEKAEPLEPEFGDDEKERLYNAGR